MSERKITFNFDEFPTLLRMAQDDVFFKMVIGPTGSAKSSACAILAFYDACNQAPWTDGVRRTRTVVVRNTFAQLEKNSIPTWRQMLGGVAKFTLGNRPYGRCRLPLPDGTVVDWEIEFIALNSPNVNDDILGMEFTNAVFEEVSQMEDQELVLAVASRYGRYPSKLQGGPTKTQIWGNTNGPRKDHWLYDWSLGKKDDVFKMMSQQVGRVYFRLYRQPPGLIEVSKGEYVANPLAENVQNLAAGYGQYFQQLIRGESAIQAYVMGDFSDLTTGKLVYPQFRRGLHTTSYDNFIKMWGKSGYIAMTFDFGRTPVCLLAYRKRTGGIIVFDEIAAENSSIDGLYLNSIKPLLEQQYPNARVDFATGDPAGNDSTQAVEITPYGVLQRYGIPIEFPSGVRRDNLDGRIEATRQRMMKLDDTGTPMLQITDNCKLLLEALTSTYIYEQVTGKAGVFRDVPTKTHVNWASDLCFIAGTMVTMAGGAKLPIEQVVAGDYVATPFGDYMVTAAGQTSENAEVMELTFSDGTILTCTPDHKIMTDTRGWCSANDLEYTDVLLKWSDVWEPIQLKSLVTKALRYVSTKLGLLGGWTTKSANAVPAKQSSQPTGTLKNSHAVRLVQTKRLPQRVPVYDLTVRSAHLFVANGLVVHNCNSLEYLCLSQASNMEPRRVKKIFAAIRNFAG